MFGRKQKRIDELSVSLLETKNELSKQQHSNATLQSQVQQLQETLKKEKEAYPASLIELAERDEELRKKVSVSTAALERLRSEQIMISEQVESLKQQVIELNDVKLLQEVGYYEPLYHFTSDEYAQRLNAVRVQQKEMIRAKTAVVCNTEWYVNNNRTQGKKWTNNAVKSALLAFNLECDNVIAHVKYHNYDSMAARIRSCHQKLSILNSVNDVSISLKYLDLKLSELTLVFEMELAKEREKEERRLQREIQREQARVEKELEEERKRLEKENTHYLNILSKLKQRQLQGALDLEELSALNEKIDEAESKLAEIERAIQEVDYRKANQRAGYVYVISNIGAFGEGVYKIGMTRRLDPLDRIAELSGASVPFRFDVHALIFSEDAPSLEAKLHNTFATRRVNHVNNRKEFFRVELSEIEEVVRQNHDRTVEFHSFPEALEYRLSRPKNETASQEMKK